MSNSNHRSASEPRERRSYPRERGNLWNPPAPRNLDADTWRRDPSDPITPQVPPPGGRNRDDRPRVRNDRPSSRDGRGSGGDYRHPNGGRYSGSYRGRSRGRGRMVDSMIMDNSRPYRPHGRYAPPSSLTGQGTQFFSPMNASIMLEGTRFNASEALAFFAQRWCLVSNDLHNTTLMQNLKPAVYKAQDAQNGVWGQPRRHVQNSMADFLSELKLAIERDQKKLLDEAQQEAESQSPKEESPNLEEA